jgi:glycosyltransferase involved in cell wall biosynthesis
MKILFLMRDYFPPFRPDVAVLFGKNLAQKGIVSDLLVQAAKGKELTAWSAGNTFITGIEKHGVLGELLRPIQDLAVLRLARRSYDLIQVRDKTRSAILGLFASRIAKVPFVYWMSFPFVEGFEIRRQEVGRSQGLLVLCANACRALLSRKVFYGLVLRNADHVFVQSEAMRDWLARKGFDPARMTAVPMGVDITEFQRDQIEPSDDARLDGKQAIIYIGSLGKARNSAFLLDLLIALRVQQPDLILILAGDAVSRDERQWIRDEIAKRDLQEHVLLTGWLEQKQALRYAVRARVGLSPIPRGELFDVSSPTKLVEYLALGLPSVANDIPDQKLVIEQSGAGFCVPMAIDAFRDAVLRLLMDDKLHAHCAQAGPPYVQAERTYDVLAQRVADAYRNIVGARA